MSKTGKLFYNTDNNRMDIEYADGSTDGGLHCGTCLDVKLKGKYTPTRIEMASDWFLVGTGLKGYEDLAGLHVRI
jgi:hypothetical protein